MPKVFAPSQVDNADELEKQKEKLNKVKSRLIDAYAEELIERREFEEKIVQLKKRLEISEK
ncbi:MAG: hypothetical protein P8Y45_21470 [Exilibacterium sp.]